MLLTGLCFVAVTAIVKYVGSDIPAPEAAFLRYALGLVFLVPMLRPMWRAGLDRRIGAAVRRARGCCMRSGVMLWFYAMTQIPLAEVTSMSYLTPVFVTLGAALFLGETLALRRLVAVGGGAAGRAGDPAARGARGVAGASGDAG